MKRILAETFVGELIYVAPNLLTVKSERSNYTQVRREFCVPKNSLHTPYSQMADTREKTGA